MRRRSDLPTFSIVTPSYNQGKYVAETIESVLTQDYPNLEYSVVDGGSDDGSVEILKQYSDRLAFWVSEKDEGQSDAIAKGFSRTTGEYLAWVNSDDAYLRGALRHIGKFLGEYRSVDVVIGGMIVGDADGYVKRVLRPARSIPGCSRRGIFDLLQPSMFFRRSLYASVGGIRRDLHCRMDVDLFHRMIEAGARFAFVRRPISFMRAQPLRKTATWRPKFELERSRFWREQGYNALEDWTAKMVFRFWKAMSGKYFCDWLETRRLRGSHFRVLECDSCS